MLIKTSHILTGALLSLSLSAGLVAPAMAEPNNSELLISQLRGHETYRGGQQLNMSDFKLGTVAGKAGGIATVRLEDGTFFNGAIVDDLMVGSFYSGKDVLVIENNGRYAIVGMAHPMWITKLIKSYGLKMSAEQGSLSSRTAAIWRELEESSSSQAAIQPLPERTAPAPARVPEMTEGPVRGMW